MTSKRTAETEEDRQEERDRTGNDPVHPPSEELEEENPVGSPAQPEPRQGEPAQERESAKQRASASSSMEPKRQVGKSTEGQPSVEQRRRRTLSA